MESNSMESSSIVNYIKQKYPQAVLSNQKTKNGLKGFVLSEDKATIGVMNDKGQMFVLGNTKNVEFLLKKNVDDIFKKVPEIIVPQDKTGDISRILRNTQQIDSRINNKIMEYLNSRLESDQDIQYKVLYDTQNKEFINIKQKYVDKIDEIANKYNVSIEKLKQCKNMIMNQKSDVIESINKYKQSIKNYVKSKNLKISDLKELYEKTKTERQQIQNKLDELLVIYQKENEKKSQSEKTIQQTQTEIDKLKKDNEELAKRDQEVKRLKSEIDDYVKTIKEKQEEIDKLKSSLDTVKEKQSEIETIKQNLDTLKDKIRSVEGVTTPDSQSELNDLKAKLEEQTRLYNEKNAELNASKKESDDKADLMKKHEAEIAKLKQSAVESNRALEKMLEDNKIEIAQLKQTIENNLKTIKEKQDEIDTLKKSLDLNVASTKDLQQKIQEKQTEIENLKRTFSQGGDILQQKEKEISDLKNTLQANDKIIADQKKQLEVLTGSTDKSSSELNETIKQRIAEIQELKKTIQELTNKDVEKVSEIQQLRKRIGELEIKISEKESEIAALKMATDKSKGELDKIIESKKGELESKMKTGSELEQSLKQKENEVADLKKQIEKYGSDIEKLEKTIRDKTEEIDKLNNKLNTTSKTLDEKIAEKEKEISDLKSRLEMSSGDLSKQLQRKQDEIEKLKSEMTKTKQDLEQTIQEKQKQILMYQEKGGVSCKELEQTISDKERQVKDIENELQKRSGKLEKDIADKQDEIDKLNNKLNSTSKQYEDKLTSKQEQLDKLQSSMNSKVESLQKKIEEKERELENFKKTSIETSGASDASSKKLISEKDNEIKNLNEQLKKTTEKMQVAVDEKVKEIAKLNEKLEEKTKSVEQTLKEKEKEKETLDQELKGSTEQLRVSLQNKQTELDKLNDTLNKLKQEMETKVAEKDNEINQMKDKMTEIEKQMQEKNNEINKLKENSGNVGELKQELEETTKQLNALVLKSQNSTEELEKKIEDKQSEIAELKKNVSVSDKGVEQKELEIKRLNELVKTTNIKKDEEINKLRKNINDIQKELNKFKDELSKTKLQNALLEGYRKRCKDKFIKDKALIIQAIKDYKNKWIAWSKTMKGDTSSEKMKLFNDLTRIQNSLKNVMKDKELLADDYNNFKQSANEIKAQLEKTISEQIVELNKRDEQIKELSDQKYDSAELQEKNKIIERLQLELAEVRRLLSQNDGTKIQININCDNALKNFCSLNNIFFRKVEIIKKLDEIINNNLGVFSNLDDVIKNDIKDRFGQIKSTIMKHIDFLNLKKYINDQKCRQYLDFLKNESTRNKVPVDFCNQMVDLLDYWNLNKIEYREQDRLLTNIYEDLSGAIRVYVRIKPLPGPNTNVVLVKTFEGKKSKSVTINCGGTTTDFGEFYGVFDDTFSNNIDLYTGVKGVSLQSKYQVDVDNIIESSESINPGLYSVFKQAEDGYSIVLFGYGASGSGKTFTLLGSPATPGLIHYGFANLQNVKTIKLKYLFEQYFGTVNINFNKLTGKIHNLIREVPQLLSVSKNENDQFKTRIPSDINIDDLKVEQFNKLTDIITAYRKEKGRIKRTPNNTESSRSHLYMVFEVSFTTGKKGYISLIDMAGRESPIDIFNTFIDTSKTNLASIMSPSGEVGLIRKTLRSGLDYTPENVFEILKEGFYINETINHLIYYFNKKNFKPIKPLMQVSDSAKYDVTRYYVKPQEEEQSVKFNVGNNCIMIPILKFLEGLSSKGTSSWLPTKFITIVGVRQEEKYCKQSSETLQFAQAVKSS
jgi:chromosome segregation ATPase